MLTCVDRLTKFVRLIPIFVGEGHLTGAETAAKCTCVGKSLSWPCAAPRECFYRLAQQGTCACGSDASVPIGARQPAETLQGANTSTNPYTGALAGLSPSIAGCRSVGAASRLKKRGFLSYPL